MSNPRKQRARTRKRKDAETEQASASRGNGKAQGGRQIRTEDKQPRPTFESGLEAAAAAFRERGGDIGQIRPCRAAATGGGMPYEVYTDGENEVAVCEVRGTGQYFVATLEELGLAEGRRARA